MEGTRENNRIRYVSRRFFLIATRWLTHSIKRGARHLTMLDENDWWALNMIKERYCLDDLWSEERPENWPGVQVIDGRVVSLDLVTNCLPKHLLPKLSYHAPLLKFLGKFTKLDNLKLNGHSIPIDLVKPAHVPRQDMRWRRY